MIQNSVGHAGSNADPIINRPMVAQKRNLGLYLLSTAKYRTMSSSTTTFFLNYGLSRASG
jgi:hypothetical protein